MDRRAFFSDMTTPQTIRTPLTALPLRVTERKWLLAIIDLILLNGALLAAIMLRTDLLPHWSALISYVKWYVTLSLIWFGFAHIFDLYNLARASSSSAIFRATLFATIITALAYSFVPWFTPPLTNRTQILFFVLFSIIALLSWRLIYAQGIRHPVFQQRALIITNTDLYQEEMTTLMSAEKASHANPFRGTGYQIVGIINEEKNHAHLHTIAQQAQADELILALTPQKLSSPLMEGLLDCREKNIPIHTIDTIYERLTSRVSLSDMGEEIMRLTSSADDGASRINNLFKRLLDLTISAIGLIVLFLLIPLVALINRLTSRGPLFYTQERVGKGGKPFLMYKFRSMITQAEANGEARWAEKNDPRTTPIGRWLRTTHLDELPQLINILRGEMSLVGPRPERPAFVQTLSQQLPFYRARHAMLPGVTGWAQIHQNYSDSIEGTREKLEYDLYYIKHASPLLDTIILLRTIAKVFGLQGR